MKPVETAPVAQAVRMEITSPLQHLCPFKDEVDRGTITVQWQTVGATLELHSLRASLQQYESTRISHEELTTIIRESLSAAEGIRLISVTTTWETAGMEVTCSTSQTPAHRL